MGQRIESFLDRVGEGLRQYFLIRNRAKFWSGLAVSTTLFLLVKLDVINMEQAQQIEDLYRAIVTGETVVASNGREVVVPGMKAQLDGITEVMAGSGLPTEPASYEPDQTQKLAELEMELSVVRTALEDADAKAAAAESDRREAWQMYDAAVAEGGTATEVDIEELRTNAFSDGFNQGRAAGIVETETNYEGKTCVANGQFADAIRIHAERLCGITGSGE